MDFTLNNNISQRQQNTLTPKMVEQLKILQMSNLELENYLEQELIDNPILEVDNLEEVSEDELSQWANIYENRHTKQNNYSELKDFTEYTSTSVSLREFLVSQVKENDFPDRFRKVILYLIENIDEKGYLITTVGEVAADLKTSEKLMIKALRFIQELEPAGVGARNLKECIYLQLKRKNQINDDITNIIKNYLSLLARRSYNEISAKTGLSKDKIIKIHSIIKTTDPKPGQRFSNEAKSEYIKPELLVQQSKQGYIVMFSYDWNIDIKLNSSYKKMLETSTSSKEVNKYIKTKMQKAIDTIRAVEQRKDTIIKVATYIINYQGDFFREGYKKIKPLTMKMVADNVGLHESTISRTVNGKYIQTPKGIFELKYFFSNKIESRESNNSSIYIKKSFEKIINSEDKSKPLSDEQIRKLLETEGIKVARRTIAKYREKLKILPTNLRRNDDHKS